METYIAATLNSESSICNFSYLDLNQIQWQ